MALSPNRPIEIFRNGLYFTVSYAPWNIVTLCSEEDAALFVRHLKLRLEALTFQDYQIGMVLRVRNEIIRDFDLQLPIHYGD